MKRIYIISLLCLILLMVFLLYPFDTLLLGRPPMKILKEIELNEQYRLTIVSVGGNATAQDNIQIRKTDKQSSRIYMIRVIDDYNNMEGYSLSGDSLFLFLRDTIRIKEKLDTFSIDLSYIEHGIK